MRYRTLEYRYDADRRRLLRLVGGFDADGIIRSLDWRTVAVAGDP